MSAAELAGPLAAPSPPRSPWQRFYGAVHRLRRRYWRRRAARLPRPVVSVGNLSWGGGGKTPVTAAVAAHLRDRGMVVAILSRGYGSEGTGVRVVSRGEGPLLGPGVAGDEPVLLAGMLPGVAVVVAPDRHLAGRHALARLDRRPDVFVLDDGFSHLRLARDLDLLVFPAADPFAGARLPPGGRLREPLAAARHADAALLTGAGVAAADAADLAAALGRFGFSGRGFAAPTRPGAVIDRDGAVVPPPRRVVAVSGVARPEAFAALVHAAGFEVAEHLVNRDHHRYDDADLATFDAALRRTGADLVVTTGKDRVKLQGRYEGPLAELPITAEPEPAFWRWLDDRLDALLGAAR